MDIDTIEPGLDFVEVIEQAVGSCDVLIALIGKQWLTVSDAKGRRRLDNPEDFVRLEIKTALARKIRVIPALIPGATMPHSEELPEVLQKLARHNAIPLSERFHPEVDWLIKVVEKVLMGGEAAPSLVAAPSPPPKSRPAQPPKILPPYHPFEPELILIPAGEFLMGSDPQQDKILVAAKKSYQDDKTVTAALNSEQPQHRRYLPDYYLAKTPLTNGQFAAFVQATDYQTQAEQAGTGWVWRDAKWQEVKGANWQHPTGPDSDISHKSQHPVVQVSWHDALAYCKWLTEVTGKGYRLPSEAEWEKAARGPQGQIYPWGNEWEAQRCNTFEGGKGDTTPVGAYPSGASPYGLLDMAGNVWEWTVSLWGADVNKPDFKYPYQAKDGREELTAGDKIRRVGRGGSFSSSQYFARCASRGRAHPSFRSNHWGCRVAVSPTP